MIDLYYNPSPNPSKVVLFLEEAGLDYRPIPVDALAGEQFSPEFVALNPNSKVPVIVDDGIVVFDSNAILLYLAEKTGLFLPTGTGTGTGTGMDTTRNRPDGETVSRLSVPFGYFPSHHWSEFE